MRLAKYVVIVGVVACGAAKSRTEPAGPPVAAGEAKPSAPSAEPSAAAGASPVGASRAGASSAPHPDAAALFARLEPEFVRCYEAGRKANATMLDGRLTINASIDASGKPACVIPSDDTGLTREVEDCMVSRFAEQTFEAAAPWSTSLPVVVRAGKVELGQRKPDALGFESVETFRMPDAFEVLEALVPELQSCVRDLDRSSGVRTMMVGARVGTDGRTQCALATASTGALPSKVADCAADVFRRARFPPPKGGPGLVLVPLNLFR